MASGLFVDPTTLLRLTPLISSTCTLWFAWDQRVMYSTFTHPDLRNESSAILPLWWRKVLDLHEIERVLLPVTITTVASIVNIRKHGALLRAKGSWAWYAAGAALAVGQYVLLQHRRFCFQAAFGESLVDVSGLLKPGDWLWLSTALSSPVRSWT